VSHEDSPLIYMGMLPLPLMTFVTDKTSFTCMGRIHVVYVQCSNFYGIVKNNNKFSPSCVFCELLTLRGKNIQPY
jgi:hypothetical protein